ncbi:hypothetical protein FQN57_000168 [Myotisia sp. PD_48]|nr:hypothetical protein FQN57_000168 [Myotisia sp. PD_48]
MSASTFAKELAIESWILYTLGIFLIGCRMCVSSTPPFIFISGFISDSNGSRASRRIAKGAWKRLQMDDYLMMVVSLTLTGVIVCVNETAINGSNYLPPGQAAKLSPEQVKKAIWGSKMTFYLEHFTLASIWMAKACILFIYARLTMGLKKQHLIVKLVSVYVGLSFVVIEILFCVYWCGPPITMYWDVPVVQSQCATYYKHMILTTAFNISSDIMMISIPLPLLVRSKLPLRSIFSLGAFVILTAILNRYYNFTKEYDPIFLKWYVGEVATAVYVANVPHLWPLLKRLFDLNAFAGSSRNGEGTPNHGSRDVDKGYPPYRRSIQRQDTSVDSIVGHMNETEPLDIEQGPYIPARGHGEKADIELRPADEHHSYSAIVTGGETDSTEIRALGNSNVDAGILRTVQLTQYRE